MTSLEKYNKIAPCPLPSVFCKSQIFKPTGDDYTQPYVIRYFVKKINDSDIIEVGDTNYESLSTQIYDKVYIKWRISGQKTSVTKNGIKTVEGVIEFNNNQIKNAEAIMPGISKRLKNPLEGYKQI